MRGMTLKSSLSWGSTAPFLLTGAYALDAKRVEKCNKGKIEKEGEKREGKNERERKMQTERVKEKMKERERERKSKRERGWEKESEIQMEGMREREKITPEYNKSVE